MIPCRCGNYKSAIKALRCRHNRIQWRDNPTHLPVSSSKIPISNANAPRSTFFQHESPSPPRAPKAPRRLSSSLHQIESFISRQSSTHERKNLLLFSCVIVSLENGHLVLSSYYSLTSLSLNYLARSLPCQENFLSSRLHLSPSARYMFSNRAQSLFFASESLSLITNTRSLRNSTDCLVFRITKPQRRTLSPRSMTAINTLRSSKNLGYHTHRLLRPSTASSSTHLMEEWEVGIRSMFGIDEALVGKLPHLLPILWRSERLAFVHVRYRRSCSWQTTSSSTHLVEEWGWHSFMFGIDEAVVGKLPHLPPTLV